MLRVYDSHDWPMLLPKVIKNFNNLKRKSLNNLSPIEVTPSHDAMIRKFRKSYNCEPSIKEQLENELKYFEDKSKLQPNSYVYLEEKKTAFSKSYKEQVLLMLHI